TLIIEKGEIAMNDKVRKQDPISGAQNIKEGSMKDRTLLRIGAVLLIVGVILTFAVGHILDHIR
ncbi:MAG: hypothetical protein QGM50_11190, partial [Anaerolineae bacterium]|nr:hypothetical protein [Anaerolineae bacterium]